MLEELKPRPIFRKWAAKVAEKAAKGIFGEFVRHEGTSCVVVAFLVLARYVAVAVETLKHLGLSTLILRLSRDSESKV